MAMRSSGAPATGASSSPGGSAQASSLRLAEQLASSSAPEPTPQECRELEPRAGLRRPRGPDGDGWRRPLGVLLVEWEFLAQARARLALAEQRRRPELRLGEILVTSVSVGEAPAHSRCSTASTSRRLS